MLSTDEIVGLSSAFLAALSFGSYGVPMKGEAATRVDVDPLVFQSYKAFTVLLTSTLLILINNVFADDYDRDGKSYDNINYHDNPSRYWEFQKWTFEDFTPWAFVSAMMWVPGGTAGVYAIRRAGLAISVGIWSCVIVMLSFVWGVLIFHEKQRGGVIGGVWAMVVLCGGLYGIAYFSSGEAKRKNHDGNHGNLPPPCETTMLLEKQNDSTMEGGEADVDPLDFETYPHCGAPPHSHQTIHLTFSSFIGNDNKSGNRHQHFTLHVSKYHLGILMAVLNGVLAATIMVPLHYAPPNTTHGVGYSMSFGFAAMIVVIVFWFFRFLYHAVRIFAGCSQCNVQVILQSCSQAYDTLPSFHINDMWRPGLLAGLLYSIGNLCGIVSIQKLGNFMGYSLNQTSMIVSGLWGIFYYREIPGMWNIIGFLSSAFVVMVGILLLGHEHVG
mmetsp:Transcript_2799/g.5798  ORF Transcript_2799/g.5798 Transcript_2799/m.5798 type:complete len:441 (+) Transcript_2799:551-1873(+)